MKVKELIEKLLQQDFKGIVFFEPSEGDEVIEIGGVSTRDVQLEAGPTRCVMLEPYYATDDTVEH